MFEKIIRIVGYQPPSTNKAYVPTANRRKNSKFAHAYFRKSDVLINWQNFINRAFESGKLLSEDEIYSLRSMVVNMNLGVEVYIKVSIPKNIYFIDEDNQSLGKDDASNFIKSIEDSIFHNLGFDDRRTIKITSEKGYNEDNVWFIEVKLTEHTIFNRIDVNIKGGYHEGD